MSSPNSLWQTALVALCLCFMCSDLYSQNNSSGYDPFDHPAIMHIGYLNTDCVPDTIYGLLDQNLRWTPRYICWGALYDSNGTAVCDAGKYESTIARSRQQDTTHFSFPDWEGLSCAISIEHFNKNDTLFDAIFWLSGVVSLPGRGRVDTNLAVVLFGQSALETHTTLDLGAVGTFRKAPFYAMQLGKDRELINPKKRESATRRISWELVRSERTVLKEEEDDDSTRAPSPQMVSSVEAGEAPFTARVYPNPASLRTSVDIKPLPSGAYSVVVLSANGSEVSRSEIVLHQEGQILETLDLREMSSGHYFIRVTSGEQLLGVWPVVVVR